MKRKSVGRCFIASLCLAACNASAHLPWNIVESYVTSDFDLSLQDEARYGARLASGDFNCDGFDDLATGSAYRDIGDAKDAGLVMIQYAGPEGFAGGESEWLHQNIGDIVGAVESSDRLGDALASGDFNGDGCGDLAIGVPGESIESVRRAGAVHVLYGSSEGISTGPDNQMFHQDVASFDDVAEEGDEFGWSVAAGDFNADGYDDLAIGVPGEDIEGPVHNAGIVHVLHGSASGLAVSGHRTLVPGRDSLPSANHYENFGYALAFGDIHAHRVGEELVVGHPGREVNGAAGAGMVSVMVGDGFDPAATSYTQNSPGIVDIAEEGDRFGGTLAVADFNGDGFDDIAASAPFEDTDIANVGMVVIMDLAASPIRSRGWLRSDLVDLGEVDFEAQRFGAALAAGDFDGDGFADLVIGVPDAPAPLAWAGTQFVLHGRRGALLDQRRAAELLACDPSCAAGEQRGSALASGHFDAHPGADLATGIPRKRIADTAAGMVEIRYSDTLFRNEFD